ncbi:hypothetical protein ACFM35_04155 [Microbacterium sp. P01]|uniref:hypothetical protein n=1 Tax=Microbacterium sp. P01 TaxID=3366261 RepID=UPI00366BA2BF
MVAHVLRLRLSLLLGALRGDPSHVVRTVSGIVLLLIAVAAACAGVLTLQDASSDVALAVVVIAGSAVTLGFALAPLMAGAIDPLDPRRFAILGLEPRPLAATLALAGLISVPVASLVAVGICLVIVWSAHGMAWIVAVFGIVIAVVTCSLFARVCMALAGMFLRERRSRELTGLFAIVVLVVVVPVGVFLGSLDWQGSVPPQLSEAVTALAFTPLGAAWALPGRAAQGAASAWASAGIALATVALLALLWIWVVRRVLTTTERPVVARERGGLGWFTVAPATPAGGVAARSLTYWLRDRRYLMNIVVVPVASLIMLVPLVVAGVPWAYAVLVPVPIAALFFGWLPHNDLAYDSTAVWMHIASGIRGVSDRIGRLVPVLLIAVPVLAIAVPLTTLAHGRWALLPAIAGVCTSLFLCGLGLSSISSVLAPYAVTRPGDSPFQQPQRTGAAGGMAQGLVLLGAVVFSLPALWWAWQALTGDVEQAIPALWAGVGAGLLVLVAGIVIGSFVFERRSGRLMEFAEST